MGYWIIWICLGVACGIIADTKGRNKYGWAFIGFMIPPAIVLLLLLKEVPMSERKIKR